MTQMKRIDTNFFRWRSFWARFARCFLQGVQGVKELKRVFLRFANSV
jgi:hypothetical protein